MDSVPSSHEPAPPIAVIGMACRLPGSINSTSAFWEALLSKRNTYAPVPTSRFTHAAFHHPDGSRPGSLNIPGGHFLDSNLAAFDAGFFGISPVDAFVMDPQQRILLEVAYECLESAGVPVDSLRGQNVGVYVGAWTADYENIQIKDPSAKEAEASWITGTGRAILSNRISYIFDFKGPSMTIDTGCSASAMALHIACQALRAPSSRTHSALVGGTNLMINPEMPISMTKLGILSPTGNCATFDERANGYARADGINCLYLKRLSDALRDGDPIRAVIVASAVNSDGKTVGLAAPSVSSQEACIREAYASATIPNFTETAYYECHGTGTKVGDPIEARAIANVFGRSRHVDDPLFVGGVKTNIGHSEASSALSAVIKTVLTVESELIAPNVGFEKPNPKINFKAWKLKVPTEVLPWPKNKIVKRASVGAFGYGGANAHFIIENIGSYLKRTSSVTRAVSHSSTCLSRKGFLCPREITETSNSTQPDRPYLLIFSAKTAGSVRDYVKTLATSIDSAYTQGKRPNIADLAYTLGIRRSMLPTKAIGVISVTNGVVAEELKSFSDTLECFPEAMQDRRIGFVFTGQGAQWAGMGVELLTVFPLVARALQKLTADLKMLQDPPDWDIIEELKKPQQQSRINEPQFSQVLCTAIQICLVKLLRSWNIHPQAVVGHSSGEIAAAYASGSLTSTQAITIAYYRGVVCSLSIQDPAFPQGGMLAVGLGEQAVGQFLDPFKGRLGVACVNSSHSVTISGDVEALDLLEENLRCSRALSGRESVFFKRLHVPLAYHSHHMDSVGSLYQARMGSVAPKTGCYPMYSSVTGGLLDGRKLGAVYWRQNLESTVLFSDAVKSMVLGGASVNTLLEIGPHSALASPLRDIRAELGLQSDALLYLPTLTRQKNSAHAVLETVGKLFTHGYTALDLEMVNGIEEGFNGTSGEVMYQSRRILVDLPGYVWDHTQEYWLECRRSREWRFRQHPRHDILGARVPGITPAEPQWANVLSINNTPWIQDHVVRGNIVFPATGYICMAVEALTQYLESNDQFVPDSAFCLREISIRKPLVLGDERSRSQKNSDHPIEGSEVFLTLRAEQSNTADVSKWYRFNIHTTSPKGKENVKHCGGLICVDRRHERDRLPTPPGQPLRRIHHRQFYEALNAVGFNYGPTFSALRNLKARPDGQEMWAEMSNYMQSKTTSTTDTGGDGIIEKKVVVTENRVTPEDSEDEVSGILTPGSSSEASLPSPSLGESTLLRSTSLPTSSQNSEPTPVPPEFEALVSTESAAVETMRRLRMGQSASDHVESRHVIHPVNLDHTLQLLFGTLHSGKMSAITEIMVPVFIEEVYIATPSPNTETFTMHAVVEGKGDTSSIAYDARGQEVILVKNIEARELGHIVSMLPGGKQDPNIMRLKWVVDYDSLNQENYRKAMNTVTEVTTLAHQSGGDLKELNYCIGLMTTEMIEMTKGIIPAYPHFEKYRSWLIGLHEWNTAQKQHKLDSDPHANVGPLTSMERKMEIERLKPKTGVRGELVYAVYDNILPLFLGEIDATELFEKDDLWPRFNAAEDITQCVTSLSRLYSAKYCKANILEIGAGTGCGTQAILEGCTTNAGTPAIEARYLSYTFTDIASELVAQGKDKFGLGYQGMDFRTLNIEKDPEVQGFKRNYDIVYAINVLHETTNLRETMTNIAKLLRPGGKVHITDFISPDADVDMEYVPFAFGIDASWWRAEEDFRSRTPLILISDWIQVLQTTGFRVNFTVSDVRLSTVYACIDATYLGPTPSIAPPLDAPAPGAPTVEKPQSSTKGSIILLYRGTWTSPIEEVRQTLVKRIKSYEINPVSFDSPGFELPDDARFVLSLLEIDEPLIADLTPSDFAKFKKLMGVSLPVLWVTSNVHLASKNPKGALITGFARARRNENVMANFNLLDLSAESSTERATQISSLVKLIMERQLQIEDAPKATRRSSLDWEFCEYQGLRYVPRVWLDTETPAKYSPQNDHKTRMEPYLQNEKTLGLVCSQRAIPSSLAFEAKGLARPDLPDDHVEICPDMFGLNSEDVAISLKIAPFGAPAIACSGTIRRMGAGVQNLSIGDRIFTLWPNEFRNRLSVPGIACKKISLDTNPIDFTGSLAVYATVVRGLLHVARMEKGEKILIHRAAGAVGLAAIQLCTHIGAEIFVTCGSIEEANFLTESHGILPDQIFSSRDTSFREAIMDATNREGVDVILNSLGGDLLHESWKCLAPCGRFIDIGKRDILFSGKLDMSGFKQNTVYAAVDITGIMSAGNKVLGRVLKDVIQLFTDGAIRPISPITRLPITAIEEAFRLMSTSTHIGNVVLTVEPEPTVQMVKVIRSPHEFRFDPEATYMLVGGFGGIGCSLAVWMAEKGAKHLTFMTRSGAKTAQAKQTLEDVMSLGCGIDVLRCDVGDFDAVETAMAAMARPLRGIIHAAMVLKDGIFENIEYADFILPLAPKVSGLLNLEKIVDQPHYPELDFFVVLSSISGVLGTPGQTNYAAAGAFEDAWARRRQLQGHRACSLDLGVISNVGYVSQNPDLERMLLNQSGIGSYNERQVQWLFQIAINTPAINPKAPSIGLVPHDLEIAQMVTGVDIQPKDVRRVRETNWFQDPKWWPIYAMVCRTSDDKGMLGDENALNARLLELLNNVNKQPTEDVILNIAQCIIWKTAVMTMIASEDINPDRPLSQYGMDSLAAVEIRNWFLRAAGVELKIEDILAAVSITSLAEKLHTGYTQKGTKKKGGH